MPVKPSALRHKTENLVDSIVFSMPSLKIWPFIFVVSIWSLMWLSIEVAIISSIFVPSEWSISGVIFFVVCFALWSALGVFLIYNILWQLFGKEEIQVTSQSIIISQIVFNYKRSKEYLADHIKDLDLARVGMRDLTLRRGVILVGANSGSISFDYGARTFKFAGCIDEAEAKQILVEIQQRYPQYKKQIQEQ